MLPRMRGLEHLHLLLVNPNADKPAQVLAGGEVVVQDGLELADDEGRRVIRARLSTLDAPLELADRADLREERETIKSYLANASG